VPDQSAEYWRQKASDALEKADQASSKDHGAPSDRLSLVAARQVRLKKIG
jgi:hypothetical protein